MKISAIVDPLGFFEIDSSLHHTVHHRYFEISERLWGLECPGANQPAWSYPAWSPPGIGDGHVARSRCRDQGGTVPAVHPRAFAPYFQRLSKQFSPCTKIRTEKSALVPALHPVVVVTVTSSFLDDYGTQVSDQQPVDRRISLVKSPVIRLHHPCRHFRQGRDRPNNEIHSVLLSTAVGSFRLT